MDMQNIAWYQEKISKNVLGYVPSMVIKYHIEEGLSQRVGVTDAGEVPR